MRIITVLAVCIAAVAATPATVFTSPSRIVGGSVTNIERWPSQANVMFSQNGVNYYQSCGGTIINNRSVLSAAHCVRSTSSTQPANRFRLRLGSSWASSGGVVHNVASHIIHASYNPWTFDSDVVILRSASTFAYNNALRAGSIAGANYNLGDNQVVWVTGWGTQWANGPASEQLREVQVWTVNQNICNQRYSAISLPITANMMCSGWLDVGGRDACQGDSGGPVYHNNIVVGVTSFGNGCAHAQFPGVNARVSRFTSWITSNA